MKRLDFPVRPHVRKYLLVHLGLEAETDYVLSKSDRFGLLLFHMLRRQVKRKRSDARPDARGVAEAASLVEPGFAICRETYPQALGIDLRNYPVHQYGLKQLTSYSVFQFNDYVDGLIKEELYREVRRSLERRIKMKDAILDFMAVYDLRDEDIAVATLTKAVQRHVLERPVGHRQGGKLVVKKSSKSGRVSEKSSPVSPKSGAVSPKATLSSLRQHLENLPLPIFDLPTYPATLNHARR